MLSYINQAVKDFYRNKGNLWHGEQSSTATERGNEVLEIGWCKPQHCERARRREACVQNTELHTILTWV